MRTLEFNESTGTWRVAEHVPKKPEGVVRFYWAAGTILVSAVVAVALMTLPPILIPILKCWVVKSIEWVREYSNLLIGIWMLFGLVLIWQVVCFGVAYKLVNEIIFGSHHSSGTRDSGYR